MSTRIAEYIWVDGTAPTAQLRSKTKILYDGEEPGIWSFDGSSTNQATGNSSDCVLRPVKEVPDPFRAGANNTLVLCEVLDTEFQPHSSNTRHVCVETSDAYKKHDSWFGMEQEYTLLKDGRPLGFPESGFPASQGQYYCSSGAANAFGRKIAEKHLATCLYAGLRISGINAEVMPGQWEFQVGPLGPVQVSDELHLARYILHRIAEESGVTVSLDPKPVKGDWNGAGCHTNFSTIETRTIQKAYAAAAEALSIDPYHHINNYGDNIEERLTGLHETCSYKEFRWDISDRGASVRIPWQVAKEGVGYIEDRRPNANCDPYVVTSLITDTVCSYLQNYLPSPAVEEEAVR
jgi:glutamine synthetase